MELIKLDKYNELLEVIGEFAPHKYIWEAITDAIDEQYQNSEIGCYSDGLKSAFNHFTEEIEENSKRNISLVTYISKCVEGIKSTTEKVKLDFEKGNYKNETYHIDMEHYYRPDITGKLTVKDFMKCWELYLSLTSNFIDSLNQKIDFLQLLIKDSDNQSTAYSDSPTSKIETSLTIPEIGYLFGILYREGVIISKYQKDVSVFISDKFINQKTNDPSWKSIQKNFASPEDRAVYDKIFDLLTKLSNRVRKESSKK
jgi:hypothetical protein